MYHYSAVQWLFIFYVYCVFGWIFETTVVSVQQRRFVNRGFLDGPMLPIYGFGLCALYLLASLEKFSLIHNPFWNKMLLFFAVFPCPKTQ